MLCPINSMFAIIIWLQLIVCVFSKGWVLESDGLTYYPMGVCMFVRDQALSFYYTCDVGNQQALYLAWFNGDACNTDGFLGYYPETTLSYDCDPANAYTDYLNYTVWDLSLISSTPQCGDLQTYTRPNQFAILINECMFMAAYGVYAIDIYTGTKWTTSYYADQDCSTGSLILRENQPTECKHNETFIEVTGYSTAMNSIQDQFGYVQYSKDASLQPLNECITTSATFSYLFMCDNDNIPYIRYWVAPACGDITDAVTDQISPFTYSCSTDTHDYAIVDTYDNTNECGLVDRDTANHTSAPNIVNQCFNWIDADNSIKSAFVYCTDTALWSVIYNLPHCNSNNGSSVGSFFSEDCTNNDQTRHFIDCQITDQMTTTNTSTEPPLSSSSPTASAIPTVLKTPAPTIANTRRIYVTADGQDNYNCYYNGTDCGTFLYASFAAHLQYQQYNLSAIEIVIQGQNPIAIQAQLAALTTGKHTNPCLPMKTNDVDTPFDTITYTFDPNYIHSLSDWYNVQLCENHNGDVWNNFFSSAVDESSTPFTFIVNNLVIDSYTFQGRRNQPFYIANVATFVCNNCVFRDLRIVYTHHDNPSDDRLYQQPTLMLAENIQLTGCVIDNVRYIPSATVDEYSYDFSFARVDNFNTFAGTYHSYSLSVYNTTVTTLNSLSSFVHILSSAESLDFDGLILESSFIDIAVTDALINYDQSMAITLSSSLDIRNTNFLDIWHGSILYASNTNSQITISNVNITTSQTVSQYVEIQQSFGRENLDYFSLFVFQSSADVVEIDNMYVLYQYAHELATRCVSVYGLNATLTMDMWHWSEYSSEVENDFFHFRYYCEHPIQLVDNQAVMNINGLHASNDITDATMKEFRGYIEEEVRRSPIQADSTRALFVQLGYDLRSVLQPAMIYNENDLNISSLYVYGYGAHSTIVLNVDGTLNINEMVAVPDAFCTDPSAETCVFDADTLQLQYWILFNDQSARCDNRDLHVFNSYLYGAQTGTLWVGSGSVYLHNVTIQMSSSAIVTDSDVLYVEIASSKMLDIGSYYANSYRQLQQLNDLNTPFVLQPLEVVIKDTLFSYVSPFQFDLFDAAKWWSSILGDAFESETRKISLFNNVFEINDEDVLIPYPYNRSLHYILDNEQLYEGLWDWDDEPKHSAFIEMMRDQLSQYFLYDATFLIPDNAEVQMINNKFTISDKNQYVDEMVMIEGNYPWILFDQNTSTACMSGNDFVNFAMWVKNGKVSSCVKTDIVEYIAADSCAAYGVFGAISESALESNAGKANVFNVSTNEIDTIIRAENGAVIALENNQINVHTMNDTDVLNMMSGDYLLLNTEINGDGNILVNDNSCDVSCYSLIEADFISVLHVTCTSNANDSFADSMFIDDICSANNASLLPYYIDIVPAANQNGEYAPGQKMKLNYSLYDAFENQMAKALITEPIILTYSFENTANFSRLLPDFQIIIDENGECSQCVDGITFSSITLQSVGQKYSFVSSVGDNQLFARSPLNITITHCPIGYGSTGTAICDVCSRAYFNLYAANSSLDTDANDEEMVNRCLYCSEHSLNGISCPGASNVILVFNYWASIYRYSALSESIFDADPSTYIVSGKCPPSYCCQLENGCNLLTDAESLCAANRDFESPLCGRCKDGYSELFGTSGCGQCDRNYWELLLLPLLYGLIVAVFILFLKSTKNQSRADKEQIPGKCKRSMHWMLQCCCSCSRCCSCSCCSNKNDEDDKKQPRSAMNREEYSSSLRYMMMKGLMYYYQAIAYILTTSQIQSALSGFVELYNFNVFSLTSSSLSNNNGYCLLREMNMRQKIIIQLTTTCFIVLFVSLPFVCKSSGRRFPCCCFKNRSLHFGPTIILVMLMCVGQILSVLFKLLACRQIGHLWVHYFFGEDECFDTTWIIALVCLLFVFESFAALFIWIKCKQQSHASALSNISREDHEKTLAYYSVIRPFRNDFWWWECVLFVRRSLLAFTFIVVDSQELKICVHFALIIYAFVHARCSPFKSVHVNTFETALIVCTAFCIFVDIVNSYASESNGGRADVFGDVVITLLILLPVCWYFGFALIHCRALCRKNDADDEEAEDDAEDEYADGVTAMVEMRWNSPRQHVPVNTASMQLDLEIQRKERRDADQGGDAANHNNSSSSDWDHDDSSSDDGQPIVARPVKDQHAKPQPKKRQRRK